MPITTVATGDNLTASHFNTNYRDQVVSTTTSGARPAGTEGQLIYETDTNRLYVYTGSAWEMVFQQGAWQTYTPQVNQGASSNIAKTTTYARFCQMNKLCVVQIVLNMTAAGTANAAVTVSTPLTLASAAGMPYGSGFIFDSSASSTNYPGVILATSTTTFALLDGTQGTAGVYMGQTGAVFSAALASGDAIGITASFEVA